MTLILKLLIFQFIRPTGFDLKGKRDGDGRYREMVGCLPWLLNNCWLQYRYTMDKEMLKTTVFPLLRRSVNLYRHLLFTGDDGKLHLPPTFSPETGNSGDCSFDLALLKWGCTRLIEICRILDINDPLLPEWERIRNQLVDYSVDENGYMPGSGNPAPKDHQHMSHLMMIYPLYLENIDTGNNNTLLEKSVRYFQCVQDMLLQSWGNKIRVFPALPDEWTDVAFHNLRAEGAFLISARRESGITSFVRIRSLAGEPCVICPAMDGMPRINSKNNNILTELEKGCYRLDIKKGEEVILYPGDLKPEFIIEPLPLETDRVNYFGIK